LKRYEKLIKVCEEFGGKFEECGEWFSRRHKGIEQTLDRLQNRTTTKFVANIKK